MTQKKSKPKAKSKKAPAFKFVGKEADAVKKAMNKAAREAGQKEWQNQQRENPELADIELHMLPANRCVPKASAPFLKVLDMIMHQLLFRKDGPNKTQKAIIDEINEKLDEGKASYNVWTKSLEPWVVQEIQKKIDGNLRPTVNVRDCKTLGEVRRVLKTHQHSGEVTLVYSGKITVTREAVFIGKTRYPVIERATNKALSIQVTALPTEKRQWIRLDALAGFLDNLGYKVT